MGKSLRPHPWRVVIVLTAVLVGAVLVAHLLFRMAGFPQGWPSAILYVLGIISTAGYFPKGVSGSWLLVSFSLFLMVLEWAFLLVLLPLFLREWLGEYFESRLPTELPRKLSGHVLICGYNSQVESLLQDLQQAGKKHALMLQSRETVEGLVARGTVCARGDPGEAEDLRRARLETCSVLVAAGTDQENIRVCLAAKRLREDVRVIALAELTESARVLTKAGAEAVVAPKMVLGTAMAVWVVSAGTVRLEAVAQFPAAGYLVHLRLNEGCRLLGQPCGFLAEWPGVILGIWTPEGAFVPTGADGMLRAGMTVAAVARSEDCLEIGRRGSPKPAAHVVVAGMGDVGREVCHLLSTQGVATTGLSHADEMRQGATRRSEALLGVGIARADGYVLAMDNDDHATYSALLAREMAHAGGWNLPIVARANQRRAVDVLRAAEVDEVFCLADVADTLLSGLVLGRYRTPSPAAHYRVRRGFVGEVAGIRLGAVHDGVCSIHGEGSEGGGGDCLISLELDGAGMEKKAR